MRDKQEPMATNERPAGWAQPLKAWFTGPMMVAVHALGITQITAWGTSYYCLGVLAGPIATETGWSRGFVFLGFTVALLVMGLVSTTVGQLIDRRGARLVMSVGVIIISCGQLALALADSQATYLAAWALLGLGMRCSLYDAAFAALVQVAPARGRAAISYLTLYGAFASSVFWTIGHYFNAALGWRQTLMWFAVINLAICLPLNWFGLARREDAISGPSAPASGPSTATGKPDGPVLEGRLRSIGIALFALVMSLNGFVFGVVSLQLVPLLEATGIAAATAVWVASLKGVAQFGGRLVEIIFGRNLAVMTVARITIAALPVSIALLLLGGGRFEAVLAFTLLMGMSQGVVTIVRGAVPLALFGTKGYGAVLGLIATPVLVVNALSPTVFAVLIDRWGWRTAEIVLLVCGALACFAMELMSRWYSASQRRSSAAVSGTVSGGT